jgi:hypothetical protein
MSTPDPNSFGSMPFQSGMASLYRKQVRLLEELINFSFQESTRHILPFIGAIRDNCESTLVLQQTGLLNELTLVSRIFVQRIINCCYLLNADENVVSKYLSQQISDSGSEQLQDEEAEGFLELSSNYKPSEPVSVLALSLTEQVAEIAEKAGAPKELFLVALASVFPKASEILAGSLFGNTFHFGVFQRHVGEERIPDAAKYRCEELSSGLFLGIGLLDALFRIIGKRETLNSITERSADNVSAARALMEGATAGSVGARTYADGAWERLNSLEYSAQKTVERQLRLFEKPFEDVYEAGLIAPILREKGTPIIDVRFAAIFFKRVLNDLRSVWTLLNQGYTSQAASIAASLYEAALATICLLQSDENINALKQDPHGEIPWKITEMAKMVVSAEGKSAGTAEFENSWRALYANYVWLCQIKHSSPASVVFDTLASNLGEKGYVVMAIPNVRDEDISTKAMIAISALFRSLECIEAFLRAFGFNAELPEDYGFAERVRRARDSAWQAFETHGKGGSPITIASSRFAKKYPPVG